jgi:hypothetical protein
MGQTRLTEEESEPLRRKPVLLDKHANPLNIRLSRKADRIIPEGDIFLIGKNKYRAVLECGNKTLFQIFKDTGDYIEVLTTDETSRGRRRWD